MKFCMVSKCGEGAGILYRIAQEGNDVSLHLTEKDSKKVYDGLLDKSFPQDADCYIFDCSGNGKIADKLKKSGKRVVGGDSFADEIEEDRKKGIELMNAIGVQLPQTEFFKDYTHAREFIHENSKTRWVFKPCGRGLPSRLTYTSDDSEQLLRYLDYIEKEFASEELEFLLQEFVEGVAISTEGWFNGKEFLFPFNHTIENKKFGNGNLGPSTGCEGNIVWLAREDDVIVQAMLNLEDILKDEEFIGPIDINCIVNEKGFYGLEWTPRFGYDATPTMIRLFNDDLGKFFMEMEELPLADKFAGGLRVSIPPYPYEPLEDEPVPHHGGLPLAGISNEAYLYEVMLEDELVHSGGVGLLAVLTNVGSKFENVLDKPYKQFEELKVPDKYCRLDLQEVLNDDYKKYKEIEVYA